MATAYKRPLLYCAATIMLAFLLLPGQQKSGAHQAHRQQGSAKQYRVTVTPELAAQGQKVFARYCASCHNVKSERFKVGPSLKGLFKRELTPVLKHPVNEANIRDHIWQGSKKMPSFPQIKGPQMDGLIAYLKTL